MILPNRSLGSHRGPVCCKSRKTPTNARGQIKVYGCCVSFQEPSGCLFIFIPVIDKVSKGTVPTLLCQFIQHGNQVI